MTNGSVKDGSLRLLGVVFSILIVLGGLSLDLLDPLPMQTLRNNVFDQYQRWAPRDYESAPVVVVDIDDESLSRLGQWPWPRNRLAELIRRLQGSGVAAIGFDMLFAEPDRTSPRLIADVWPVTGLLRDRIMTLPDHDKILASQIAKANDVVLGFVLLGQSGAATGSWGRDIASPPYRYVQMGVLEAGHLPSFQAVSGALPMLASVTEGYGALNFVADSDGIIRRVPMVLALNANPVPSLLAELLRVAVGEKNYLLMATHDTGGIEAVRIGELTVPTTPSGEMWLHYSRSSPSRYLPAWQLFVGEVPAARLAGSIVLIGSSAPGLMDLRFSPLHGIIPGVEIHAQALEQILSGRSLQRPQWAPALEALSILFGGLAIALLASRARALTAAILALTLSLLALAGGWLAFRYLSLLINTVTPALVFLAAFVFGSLIHHFISERETRWIKSVFSRYVSPNRVHFLMQNPEALVLGGRRQECSFIFTDLENFTALMESIAPEAAVDLLNRYLDHMIAIAFRHDGTLDRIVGDSVAIMFSAPVPQADHRARALACALEMDAFAAQYAADEKHRGLAFGKTRIGIHSGEVIVGNFGGGTMFDYRALGDPVNTASRLESVNKQLGTTICISETTISGCGNSEVRRVGRLVLKGKRRELQAFEPMTERNRPLYAPKEAYEEAYDLMAKGNVAIASEQFEKLSQEHPDDPLVALHLRRMREGAIDDLLIMSEK